jgi:hypothetical protein
LDICRRLQTQYGDETLSRSKTLEWCKRFKDGCVSVSDDPGRGGSQPKAVIPVNIQHVECLILDNQRTNCHEMFMNDYVHCSNRKIRLLCNFTTGYASFIQAQVFHALKVHRNDYCGLGTTMAGIVTDGRTAIVETFTPFSC